MNLNLQVSTSENAEFSNPRLVLYNNSILKVDELTNPNFFFDILVLKERRYSLRIPIVI